jgi:molybdopterin-containing oxidoreductase family iron-sulfur binding subunit
MGAATAVGAVGVGAAVQRIELEAATPPRGGEATSDQRWGMVIDLDRCARGCTSCADACRTENNVPLYGNPKIDNHWIRVVTFKDKIPNAQERQIPLLCNHCTHAPCAHVCPVAATFKRADGVTLVDKHRCIGCRYCVIACPYKARNFVYAHTEEWHNPDFPKRMHGVAEGCHFCVHRVDHGEQPACVQACVDAGHGAMAFGDLKDPNSIVARQVASSRAHVLRPELALGAAVYYMGL